jgi:hypothetical protein
MRRSSLLSLIALAILCGVSMGQMSTLPAAQAIADLPGPPKNPPIFSQMTVIWQGGLQYQNTIDMKGPVASIRRLETSIQVAADSLADQIPPSESHPA